MPKMAPFKKKQQLHASIVLSRKPSGDSFHSPPHHFLSNETITGWAEFTASTFSHAKVTLKGLIKTTTEKSTSGATSKEWRTEQLPFLGVLFEKQPEALARTTDGIVRIPFKFKLSECEKLAAFVESLPPSLDSRREGQRPTDPQFEVSYNITATSYSKRGTVSGSTVKQVFIDPISSDSLSDTSSDTPGEYFWAQKGISRSKSLQPASKGPRIELAGQEPPGIMLDTEHVESEGSTDIPFIVKLSPQAGEKLSRESFPADAKVQAHLVTKTSMTPDGMKGISSMISLDYIKITGRTTNKSQSSHHQSHTAPIMQWERSVSDGADSFAVARFSFPFELHGAKRPTPTFYTPLLSRRYFIDLTISFDGANDTFNLSVPCEIVHTTDLYDVKQDASDSYYVKDDSSDFYDAKEDASDFYDAKESPGGSVASVQGHPHMDRRATAP